MTIRSDREVDDAALLTDLNKQLDAALAIRISYPKEAHGTYNETVDDQYGWGTTFANADPNYATAQADVMRISDEIDKARVSYFRLNVWGMARYRDTMDNVGMGYWPNDHPHWPKAEDFGITDDHLDVHRGDAESLTPEQNKACEAFKAEVENVRSAHLEERPGIPLVKFSTNDGWLVTPVECLSALQLFGEFLVAGFNNKSLTWQESLAAFRKADQDTRKMIIGNAMVLGHVENAGVGHRSHTTTLDNLVEDYFLDWLRYLEVAAQHQGFEVW